MHEGVVFEGNEAAHKGAPLHDSLRGLGEQLRDVFREDHLEDPAVVFYGERHSFHAEDPEAVQRLV